MPAPRQFVNGNSVHGAAAQQHIIKKNGGWDSFINKIATDSADEAVSKVISKLQEEFSRTEIRRIK